MIGDQFNQKRKVRRSIFVGLGGTGNEVIRRLKREMVRHGFGDLPAFQYAVLDTVAFDEKPGMDSRMHLRNGEEYIYIGNYSPNEVLKNLDGWPVIGNWWGGSKKTSLVTVDEGAGQMRAVGRMGFFYHFDMLEAKLRQMAQTIMNVGTRETAFEREFEVANQGPIIYLVFSLCGGTGSGLFLDVAYVLRHLLTSSDSPPTIVAVAMLPGPYLQAIRSLPQQERIQANAYAALTELERLHNIALGLEERPNGKDIWNVQYSSTFHVASSELPFDYIYLIDDTTSKGEKHTRERLYDKLSQAIFWLSGPSTGHTFWERAKNLSSKTLAGGALTDSSGTKRLPIYSSLGVSMVMYEWETRQVRRELENVLLECLCEQTNVKAVLPSLLNTANALIEAVSGEQTGINPIPATKELPPVGVFNDQGAVDDMLQQLTTKYETVLSRLLKTPVWEKSKERFLTTIRADIKGAIANGLQARGPVVVRQELDNAVIHLNALKDAITELRQKEEQRRDTLQEEYSNQTRRPSHKNILMQTSDTILAIIGWIYLFARFRRGSNTQSRELQQTAKNWAHQRYLWYDAAFKVVIYDDIIKSIIVPFIADISEEKRIFEETERNLRTWLSANKNTDMSVRSRERAWFENIRPQRTEKNQVQATIDSQKIKIDESLQQILEKAVDEWHSRRYTLDEALKRAVNDEIEQLLKRVGGDEHLAERMLSPELSSQRRLFLQGADCLWNFERESNQETKRALEAIDMLGYGTSPQQQKTWSDIQHALRELLKDEAEQPDLIPTDIDDEMALVKTQHGLMVSSLRSMKDMQHSYLIMKIVKRAPYLHLDSTYQATRAYKPLISLESTPQQIIDEWRRAADRLEDKNSDLARRLRDYTYHYEAKTGSNRQEQIDVNNENHPFFDFVDQLWKSLYDEMPKQTPPVVQALLLYADMQEILHTQGWLIIEPGPGDRFDSVLHREVGQEQIPAIEIGRVTKLVRQGYVRYRKGDNPQVRKAWVMVNVR